VSQIGRVFFDLGNVLAHINFNAFWESLGFHSREEIAPFIGGYKLWTLRYEIGSVSTLEYLNELYSVFNHHFSIAKCEQAFASIIQEPVEGMLEIVKRVSSVHQTALVSNTNEIHYKLSMAKIEVLKILPKHYLSFQLYVMKPAKEFYDAIIKDQGVSPSEMLFIDDIIENVEAANAVGMRAIKFEGVDKLDETLRSFKIY
jgi:putative hydrolase of the HAD superfamily